MARDGKSEGKTNSTYMKWLLEAVRKVKSQKQRPSSDRICSAVRQTHKVSQESIVEQLELAVKDGALLKVFTKGICSYRDPEHMPKVNTRTLNIGKKGDLTKTILKSVKELAEVDGSSLKTIEKYIRGSYCLDADEAVLLPKQLRLSLKKGIESGKLSKNGRLVKVAYSGTGESDSTTSTSSGSFNHSHPEDDLSGHSESSFSFDTLNKVSIVIINHVYVLYF